MSEDFRPSVKAADQGTPPDGASPGGSLRPRGRNVRFRGRPAWLAVAPYFMSAVLFLSGFFAIFAALPFQALWVQGRRATVGWALVVNLVLVGLLGGLSSLVFFSVFAAVPGLVLGWALLSRRSLAGAMGVTLAAMLTAVLMGGLFSSAIHGVSPAQEVSLRVAQVTDALETALSPEAKEQLRGELDWVDWKTAVLREIPSAFALFAVIQIWISLIVLIRANPGGRLSRLGLTWRSVEAWKVPDWVVWPTIICGFFLVFENPAVTPWASGTFRVLMSLYAIQGVVILGNFLESWGIRGWLRTLVFLLVLFVMMPLLLAIGFFDQWFDFRKNLRQST